MDRVVPPPPPPPRRVAVWPNKRVHRKCGSVTRAHCPQAYVAKEWGQFSIAIYLTFTSDMLIIFIISRFVVLNIFKL